MSKKIKKVFLIAGIFLILIASTYAYNIKFSIASDQELINIIRQAETWTQRMMIPPGEYVGKAENIPDSIKNQMLANNMAIIDNLFSGKYKDDMKNLINSHFSKKITRNCVDGGVTKINVKSIKYTESGAEVTADVYKYLTHRENRNGKIIDIRLDGKGTYQYTFEKNIDGWKIINIDGALDLDYSKISIFPAQ